MYEGLEINHFNAIRSICLWWAILPASQPGWNVGKLRRDICLRSPEPANFFMFVLNDSVSYSVSKSGMGGPFVTRSNVVTGYVMILKVICADICNYVNAMPLGLPIVICI